MRRGILWLVIGLVCGTPGWSPAEEEKTIQLFNGQDLAGWTYFLEDENAQLADVWSVQDGVLVCKGQPMGYLATEQEFKNFKLVVEWRWAPGKEPGNSGVLLRITGKPMMLPKCVEAQLQSGNAGDIWAFQGFQVQSDTDRFRKVSNERIGDFMGVSKESGNEKAPGEWNKYEITLDGDALILVVNGKKVNECQDCDVVAGQIGLQSEGGEIHFKTVELTPLDD